MDNYFQHMDFEELAQFLQENKSSTSDLLILISAMLIDPTNVI
jgi:hypothetical protein